MHARQHEGQIRMHVEHDQHMVHVLTQVRHIQLPSVRTHSVIITHSMGHTNS